MYDEIGFQFIKYYYKDKVSKLRMMPRYGKDLLKDYFCIKGSFSFVRDSISEYKFTGKGTIKRFQGKTLGSSSIQVASGQKSTSVESSAPPFLPC